MSDATRELRRAQGLCYRCGASSKGLSRCAVCSLKEKQLHSRKRIREVSARPSTRCAQCGLDLGVEYKPKGGRPNKFCSDKCGDAFRNPPKPKRDIMPMLHLCCVHCGIAFTRRYPQATCSSVCRGARLSEQLSGKKYRPRLTYERECTRCRRTFTAGTALATLCRYCVRAVDPNRNHGKHEKRAKRAGVPYVYGISAEKVFERDGWRCHLCGCKTPKKLRGTYKPNAPEIDHIVPINAKGGSPGHVWENVACSCHNCNMTKGARIVGQLRLVV